MNNLAGIFNALQSAIQNPGAILSRMGMPNAMQNPQQAVQDLVSSGRMTQQQFENYRQMAMQFQNQFKMK